MIQQKCRIYLPNGECLECETTDLMPKVEKVPTVLGTTADGKVLLFFDYPWSSEYEYWIPRRTGRNFNPPERWELMQDKRRNASPLGRNTYLYKARKIKSLARSTHTHSALHKGKESSNTQQCKHTFRITVARCAPCSGYNTECEHYEKNDAADTKHGDSRL